MSSLCRGYSGPHSSHKNAHIVLFIVVLFIPPPPQRGGRVADMMGVHVTDSVSGPQLDPSGVSATTGAQVHHG